MQYPTFGLLEFIAEPFSGIITVMESRLFFSHFFQILVQSSTDFGAIMADENQNELAPFDQTDKKKKKVVIEDPADDGIVYPCEGSDRNYKYEELIGRVFNLLRENSSEPAGDRRKLARDRRRTDMSRPPFRKVKTALPTMDICTRLRRPLDHVIGFLLTELGTCGTLKERQRLVVKGRVAPETYKGILIRYTNEYVICPECKSWNTVLSKAGCRFFLTCEQCGCRQTVAPIKDGYRGLLRGGRRRNRPNIGT